MNFRNAKEWPPPLFWRMKMECKYCGGIVRALNPGGMRKWETQCDNCGRYNCEKEEPKPTELEKAAKRAAQTGERKDLQAYLKMRRNFR